MKGQEQIPASSTRWPQYETLQKNIHVAVSPGEMSWKVEIRINKGNWNKDPGVYEHEEAMKKMYEYYKYYYDKNVQESE